MSKRQPEQQQQGALSQTHPCPNCKQPMKLVGRESAAGFSVFSVMTFQCYHCGQVIAITMH
jgi:hypothetical protein